LRAMTSPRPRTRLFRLAILLAAAVGVGLWTRASFLSEPTLIVLISIDTCRADRLGVAGARLLDGTSPTPVLDGLAASGAWFPNATTPAPLTLPAHVSAMSGLYPDRHGVRENDSFRVPPPTKRRYRLLAEELRDFGFATAAFVSAQPLDRRFGLDQGFAVYDDVDRASARGGGHRFRERSAAATTERAARWLASTTSERRRFVFVHYFDPHAPYERGPDAPEGLPEGVAGDYLAEIAAVDRSIGDLLRGLPKGGAEAWVIVFGDHGEGLGDHGEPTHGYFLYDSVLRVPLIVKPPASRKEPKPPILPARLVDLRATILDAARKDGDPRDGRSLLREPTTPFRDRAESLYGFYQHRYARLRALRDETTKLIEGGGVDELYLWRDDPTESKNLALDRAIEADRLRALLYEALAAAGADVADAAAPAPDVVGPYHGARSATSVVEPDEDENRKLPRAHEKRDVLRDLDAARHALERGDAAKASLLLKAHEAERDGNPALLLWTGRALRETAFDRRLDVRTRTGLLEDAAARFRTLAERFKDPRGLDLELLCLRDAAKATGTEPPMRELVRKATAEIAAGGGSALTFALRGSAKESLGDLRGAVEDFDEAHRKDPSDPKILEDRARVRALLTTDPKHR
jgi:choline-sulfatase